MNQKNYQLCIEKVTSSTLENEFKNKIILILRYYIYQASRLSCTINVTSDVLESIYGQYKLFFERSKSTDIVSSALYLPAFTGEISLEIVQKMLLTSKIKNVQEWEKENLPQSEQSKKLKAPKIFKSYKFFYC